MDVAERGIVARVVERTHKRRTGGGVQVGEGVVVGQPSVASLDDALKEVLIAGHRVVIRLGFDSAVSAEHRSEKTHFEPASIEFGIHRISRIDGKTADIVRHVTEAAQRAVDHDRNLSLKTTPAATHVG